MLSRLYRKTWAFLLLLCCTSLIACSESRSDEGSSDSRILSQSASSLMTDDDLLKLLEEREAISVIATLDVDDSGLGLTSVQNRVLSSLAQPKDVQRSYRLPVIALTVGEEDLKILLEHPQVIAVVNNIELDASLATSTALTGIDQLWSSVTGEGQCVVVVDSGVRPHSLLPEPQYEACFSANNAEMGWESLCPSGDFTEIGPGSSGGCHFCTHGMHVAGVATSRGSLSGSGVANGACLIAIQAAVRRSGVSSNNESEATTIPLFELSRSFDYIMELTETGVDNIASVNLSLGGDISGDTAFDGPCDDRLPSGLEFIAVAVKRLTDRGVTVVAASGNDGKDDRIAFPACLSRVVAVAASHNESERVNEVTDYSNFNASVDVVAPGGTADQGVLAPSYLFNFPIVGANYGTSVAAPHVSGFAALLREARPLISTLDLRRAINTSDALATRDGSDVQKPRLSGLQAKAYVDALPTEASADIHMGLFVRPFIDSATADNPFRKTLSVNPGDKIDVQLRIDNIGTDESRNILVDFDPTEDQLDRIAFSQNIGRSDHNNDNEWLIPRLSAHYTLADSGTEPTVNDESQGRRSILANVPSEPGVYTLRARVVSADVPDSNPNNNLSEPITLFVNCDSEGEVVVDGVCQPDPSANVTPDPGTFLIDSPNSHIQVQWMFDGGRYEGELGIFAIDDQLLNIDTSSEKGFRAFVEEVAKRVLSDTQAGHVVLQDASEGALCDGVMRNEMGGFMEPDLNEGPHRGVKYFDVGALTYGFVLVPNGSFTKLLSLLESGKKLPGNLRPLFSLSGENPDKTQHFGKLGKMTTDHDTEFGTRAVYALEDVRTDASSDRDYNDVVFSVVGARGTAPFIPEADLVPENKRWFNTDLGQCVLQD